MNTPIDRGAETLNVRTDIGYDLTFEQIRDILRTVLTAALDREEIARTVDAAIRRRKSGELMAEIVADAVIAHLTGGQS